MLTLTTFKKIGFVAVAGIVVVLIGCFLNLGRSKHQFARVLIVKDDRILVMKSSYDGKDVWNFPGGKKEPSEDLLETAYREVFEECGIRLNEIQFLYDKSLIHNGVNWQGRYFFSKNFQGEPSIQEPKKCSEMCFKTKEEILQLPAFSGALHEHLNEL